MENINYYLKGEAVISNPLDDLIISCLRQGKQSALKIWNFLRLSIDDPDFTKLVQRLRILEDAKILKRIGINPDADHTEWEIIT